MMDSLTVVFSARDKVELLREPMTEPAEHEVVLQTTCSLISTGTECTVLQQKYAPGTHWDAWGKFPFRPGYSQAGRVVRVGKKVKAFQVGDRVASSGPHAGFVTIDAERVWPIPQDISDEAATWSVLAYVVQRGIRKPQLALGETVVVLGLGMLGQLAVQYARAAGAGEVIAVDTAPMRLEMAAAHGATHLLETDAAGAHAGVARATGGAMAEVVFDVTGHPSAFDGALRLLRRFGRLVLIGDVGAPAQQALTSEVLTRDLQIMGSHGANAPGDSNDFTRWSHAEMIAVFHRYLQRGQMRVDDLITHRFPATDAAGAYRTLTTGRATAMGVLLTFGGEHE